MKSSGKDSIQRLFLFLKENVLRIIILVFFCSIFKQSAYSQKKSNDFSKHFVFIEAGSNSFVFGLVNYDRIFVSKEKWKFAGRAGFAYLPETVSWGIGIPLEGSFLIGKTKLFLETGLGFSYFFGLETIHPADRQYSSLYLVSRVGYRFQNPEVGYFSKSGSIPVRLYMGK